MRRRNFFPIRKLDDVLRELSFALLVELYCFVKIDSDKIIVGIPPRLWIDILIEFVCL
jgi:hypothetical protein